MDKAIAVLNNVEIKHMIAKKIVFMMSTSSLNVITHEKDALVVPRDQRARKNSAL